MTPNQTENETFLDILTLGLIRKLKQMEEISSLNVEKRAPCNRLSICAWEQSNYVSLPADLREFYASTDGFYLTWKYQSNNEKYACENVAVSGEIKVSTLSNLRRLHFIHRRKLRNQVYHLDNIEKNLKACIDSLDNCSDQNYDFSTAFILSHHLNVGTVCLVYHNTHHSHEDASSSKREPTCSIWLLDVANSWHFLAKDFSTYFRMMLVHLGMDSWQLRFTSTGLTYHCQRIMARLLPQLFQKEEKLDSESEFSRNIINAHVFKMGFTPSKKCGQISNRKASHRNKKK